MLCATYLLAGHGMTGQEGRAPRPVVVLRRSLGDLLLGAAHIGHKLVRSQHVGQPAHPVHDGEDRYSEQDQVSLFRCLHRFLSSRCNCTQLQRRLKRSHITVPTGHLAGEAMRTQGQPCGSA